MVFIKHIREGKKVADIIEKRVGQNACTVPATRVRLHVKYSELSKVHDDKLSIIARGYMGMESWSEVVEFLGDSTP